MLMGGCISLVLRRIKMIAAKAKEERGGASASPPLIPTARVVSLEGDLHEYNLPIFVSEVINAESSTSADSSCSGGFFLCNSDSLYYNDLIPAMSSEDVLIQDQIYFLLPVSKMHERLCASDMAALAVKASSALEKSHHRGMHQHRTNSSHQMISPLLLSQPDSSTPQDFYNDCEISRLPSHFNFHNDKSKTVEHSSASKGKVVNNGVSRSVSVRRLHRITSKHAKMAVRSFRQTLSTIYEGTLV